MLLFLLVLLFASSVYSETSVGWVSVNTGSATPNASCDSTSILANKNMFIWGGYNDNRVEWYMNRNVFSIDLGNAEGDKGELFRWRESQILPPPRTAHCATYNPLSNSMVIFGGRGGPEKSPIYFRDLWSFDLKTNTWNFLADSADGPVGHLWANLVTYSIKNGSYGLLEGGSGSRSNTPFGDDDIDLGDMWILDFSVLPIVLWKNVTHLSSLVPVAVDGGRLVIDSVTNSQFGYRFGGYSCISNGISKLGGLRCYHNFLYRIDLDTMNWVLLNPKGIAPTSRAYHVSEIFNGKLYVIGGSYQDSQGNMRFFNDINSYDINSNFWDIVTIFGHPSEPRWSANSAIFNGKLFLFGGCAMSAFYNDMSYIVLEVQLNSSNFKAEGTGISYSFAGNKTIASLSIRSLVDSFNGSWGGIYSWASNIKFDATVAGISLDKTPVIVPVQVVDNKDGTYDLSYTILSPGSDFQLYIHYDGVDIPGSPFHLKIFPNIMVPKNSIAVIPTTVLQDSFSTIKIYFFDKFQNPVVLSAINYFRISVIVDKNLVKAEFSVDDDILECTYRTISVSSYSVSVLIDDEIVGNSILVTAYASIEPSSGEVAFVFGFCLFCISIIAISIVFVIIFMRHPVIKAASPMIIFSILFGFGLQLAGVLVLFDPLTYTRISCIIAPFLLHVGFVISFSSILVKTYRIEQIFNSKSMRTVEISDWNLFVWIIGFTTIAICLQLVKVFAIHTESEIVSLSSNSILTYHSCSSNPLFYNALVYSLDALLIVFCTYFAIATRSVPALFNESLILGFLVFNTCFVVIVVTSFFILLEHPRVIYVLFNVGVIYCTFSNLLALLLPKVVYVFYYSMEQIKFLLSNMLHKNQSIAPMDNDINSVSDLEKWRGEKVLLQKNIIRLKSENERLRAQCNAPSVLNNICSPTGPTDLNDNGSMFTYQYTKRASQFSSSAPFSSQTMELSSASSENSGLSEIEDVQVVIKPE